MSYIKLSFDRHQEFIDFYENHTGRETAKHFGISRAAVCQHAKWCKQPRRSFKYKDLPTTLTQRQIEILNGSMLGDGCLEKLDTPKSNSRFIEKHGLQQTKYLEWKRKEFAPFAGDLTFGKEIRDSKVREYCKFNTYKCPLFTALESVWYRDRVKIIPEHLDLTPLTTAVWFMDDGYNSGKNLQIYTNGFSKIEVENLVDKLKKLGIVNCHERENQISRGEKSEIYIGKSSMIDFIDYIEPYVKSECVTYKLERFL